MYTPHQTTLLNHTRTKVEGLFSNYPVTAHGYDHVARVARRAREIAIGEKARSVVLCELSGWLHDVGRTREPKPDGSRAHHELSYEILREWYRKNEEFNLLTEAEKIELLYAVRYHWNNFADDYDTAWILRDADKLDLFGEIGLQRHLDFWGDNDVGLNQGLRNCFETLYWIHTDTAKKILREEHLVEPLEKYYRQYLREKIKPVEL